MQTGLIPSEAPILEILRVADDKDVLNIFPSLSVFLNDMLSRVVSGTK
jgi:hypothetical protein